VEAAEVNLRFQLLREFRFSLMMVANIIRFESGAAGLALWGLLS
jgi:hypothetical protein